MRKPRGRALAQPRAKGGRESVNRTDRMSIVGLLAEITVPLTPPLAPPTTLPTTLPATTAPADVHQSLVAVAFLLIVSLLFATAARVFRRNSIDGPVRVGANGPAI